MERKVLLNALSGELLLLVVSLLITLMPCYGQDTIDETKIDLTFSATHPRAKVSELPSDYIVRGMLDAKAKSGEEFPTCIYVVDWIHFRLTAPNYIDSIRIVGDYLPAFLTDFFESRVLSSRSFWNLVGKQNQLIRLSIPVILKLEGHCVQLLPDKFLSETKAIDSLFANPAQPLPALK